MELAIGDRAENAAGFVARRLYADRVGLILTVGDAAGPLAFQQLPTIEVGGLPEGVVFSADGKWLYVGNFIDQSISILSVDGTTVTNTGRTLALPAPPGSMGSALP